METTLPIDITALPPALSARLLAYCEDFCAPEDERHLWLAAHAAFPVVLTTDLLYKSWLNFRFDEQGKALGIPMVAVSDLLLSTLCRPTSRQVYEMPQDIRTALLLYLKAHPRFGAARVQRLAHFLKFYLRENPRKLPSPAFAKAQEFTWLAQLDPQKAAEQLLDAWNRQKDKGRLRQMLAWSEQQAQLLGGEEGLGGHNPLSVAIQILRGIQHFQEGQRDKALQELQALKGRARKEQGEEGDGIRMDIPQAVLERLPGEFFGEQERINDTVPLYEAKVLIVGQPGAGKTTLLRKLTDPSYLAPPEGDPDLESTVGINIHEGWEFPFPEDSEIKFKANLWDFGGQVIQYMAHHFFLTPRALYVLVADDRKQNTEFDYWFRIINLLGRESEQEKVSLLVVLNEINHESVSNFDHMKYRKDYRGMHIQVCEIDFSKEDARSKGLPETVKEMLCKLPQIGDPLPRLWAPIREELIGRRKQEPHITFADFAEICSRSRGGKSLAREEDQRYLSAYLHRLGVMLHYQDDLHLDNFIILDPHWAVAAVYSVLKDSRVEKNQGRFTEKDLPELLKAYSADERSRLLSLMLKDKFEICYPSSRPGEYIAPHLLPSVRPAYSWDSAQAMKFRYQYPFMPKGLISRLIVRLSEDIAEGGKLAWKEGVVIERGGCRAQVMQRKAIKKGLERLEIELSGPERERKFLLRHVMAEVEKIHEKFFTHIAYEKIIPCNCKYCRRSESPTFFEYSELLQYNREGKAMIICPKGKLKKVSVKDLLEEIFKPLIPHTSPEMIPVEGGAFQMGSNEDDDEKPIHKVRLNSFEIGRYTVTMQEYDAFCEAVDRKKPDDEGWGREKRPVISVDWYDAIEYCNWLSGIWGLEPVYKIEKDKKDPNNKSSYDNKKWLVTPNRKANGYRLPSEAEWEYAARGGRQSKGYRYAGSDNIDGVAWYRKNSYDKGSGHPDYGTHPVGLKKPNELGLYDMSGNVFEWCWDWYDEKYYQNFVRRPAENPQGPEGGQSRLVRGGSWFLSGNSRVANRGRVIPDGGFNYLGFRLARTVSL